MHYFLLRMKINKPGGSIKRVTRKEIQNIRKWIDQLSEEKMSQFEALSRVQLAQVLLEAYLTRKSKQSTIKGKKRNKKRSR